MQGITNHDMGDGGQRVGFLELKRCTPEIFTDGIQHMAAQSGRKFKATRPRLPPIELKNWLMGR